MIRSALIHLLKAKDTNASNLGEARQVARRVQGTDPLEESWQAPYEGAGGLTKAQVELGERGLRLHNRPYGLTPEDAGYDESLSNLSRVEDVDPSRLPVAQVSGSNAAVTLFESIMEFASRGDWGPTVPMLQKLRQLDSKLWKKAKEAVQEAMYNAEMPF